MTAISRRAGLFTRVASASLAIAGVQPAYAANDGNAPASEGYADATAADAGPEIVVSGIRGSISQSLEVKRTAPRIVDAISSEDVGKFPDTNIAESVQRITGVQIDRTRGEGRTVNIRGLPANFTLVTFNGRTLPNALYGSAASRSFDFAILPSEFVRTLEVYKTPSAEVEDGGLSGVVNVRTPRAFDIGRRLLTLSAEGQYESNSGKVSPKFSGLYSDVFADGRLGVTVGAAYSRRKPESHQNEVNYTTVTERAGLRGPGSNDLNGDGVIDPNRQVRIPDGIFYTIYNEDIERLSAIGSVDWQASDALTLSADTFYSKLRVRSTRNPSNNSFYGATNVLAAKTEVIGGIETATEFKVSGLDLRNNGRLEDSDGHIFSVNLGARLETGPWTLELSGAFSRSRQIASTLNLANAVYGNAQFIARPGDKLASIIYTDGFEAGRSDPSATRVINLNGGLDVKSTDNQHELRFDGQYDVGGSFLKTIAIGGKYVERTKYKDNWILTVTPAGVSALYGGLPAGPGGSVSAAPFMQQIAAGQGSFLGSYNGDAIFPIAWLRPDTRTFLSGIGKDELVAAGKYTNDATGITDVKEKTLAFYGRADFETDALSGNLGLRVVRTAQETTGVTPDLSGIIVETGGGFTRVPAANPFTVSRNYWDFLPSFNLKYEATGKLVLRLAASRTMARPNLGDISPTTRADGTDRIITQNNPYLDPFRSNNLDASAEWYFSRSGLIGATVFYKGLQSLIRRESTLVQLPVTYVTPDNTRSTAELEFRRSSLVNGEGVSVRGVELFYQQAYTSLPAPFDGLGTILNYTFIDNGDPKQLTAASKHNFNAVAYYEKGPIGVRLSYSWRSGFLDSVAEAPLMSTRKRPFGTLDGSVNLKISETISAVFQANNITDADESSTYDTLLPSYYLDAGRRFSFGVRARF